MAHCTQLVHKACESDLIDVSFQSVDGDEVYTFYPVTVIISPCSPAVPA